MDNNTNRYPTRTVSLPSKGWFYPVDHPLSCGTIELKQPTAYHEDILNSQNLISKGIAISRFIEALIATPNVKIADLINGDYNYLQYAARVLLYGSQYEVTVTCPNCRQTQKETIQLNSFEAKNVDLSKTEQGKNTIEFTLPEGGDTFILKLLTVKDVEQLTEETKGMRKVQGSNGVIPSISSYLAKSIVKVSRSDGSDIDTPSDIRNYVANELRSTDSLAIRGFVSKVNPDLDTSFKFLCNSCNTESNVEVPMDTNFFWPGA